MPVSWQKGVLKMKTLVAYSSKTGNTKQVAEAIMAVMPEGADICPIEEAPSHDAYDFIAVGFWVDRETADKKAQEFMSRIKGKKIALFGTLGAEPDSQHALKSMINAKGIVEQGNQVVGEFMCRGKIDPKLTEALVKLAPDHPHAMTPERVARHEQAKNHPNEEDFRNAQAAFTEILSRVTV